MSAADPPGARRLQELSEAVLEGRSIDWEAEHARAPELQEALECLRRLDALGRAHRTLAESDPLTHAPPASPPMFEWGALQVLERVGSGSFGEVYRAWDLRLQREVALKLRRGDSATGESSARRFIEEARGLARIRHPNVVAVYGTDVHDGRVGFWTEFLRGRTLDDELAREGPRSVEEAAAVGVALCQALAAVHEAGLIHGDVKASNVMREADGRIVLMDLGSFTGRAAGPSGSSAGDSPVLGTPLVSAPEVLRGEAPGVQSDLYSLGVLLYRLVAGRYPVLAESLAELSEKLERGERVALRDQRPDLPVDFVQAVERALEPRPSARYRSAGDMERALRSAVSSIPMLRGEGGQTLQSLIEELGRLPEEMCRHIGKEVARGLTRIQASGDVPADLRPDNVLLLKDGSVVFLSVGDPRGEAGREGPSASLRQLGELLSELAGGPEPAALSESPQGQSSPFYQEIVRWLSAPEAADPPATAQAVLLAMTEGEKGPWWREHRRRRRRAERRTPRRMRISRETGMHGREAELAKLRDAYERTRSGEGRVVLLDGEAGIGKTRLVDELVTGLQREGEDLNFLFGSYAPGGAATAMGAFLTAYRDHWGEERLEETLADYLATAPLLIPPFAALLKGESGTADSSSLTKDSLQTAFAHVTQSLAVERPTVVLIDDLHFAPAEGRSLFAALAHAVPGHRILLIGCTRPDLPENWMAGIERLEHGARLPLERLSHEDVVRVLAEALGSNRLAEELAPEMARRSDGNPLFLFENLRALEEAQVVTLGAEGGWRSTGSLEDLSRPSTIQHLIQARLAGLDVEDRNLLEVACCLGFEFDPALVAEAAEIEVLPALKRFALIEKRHRLIRAAGRLYTFDHHQVQEALYEGLFEQLREHYHAALATALEAREHALESDPAEVDGSVALALCEHSFRGGRGRAGLRYLQRSLDHLGTLQPAVTAQLVDRALAVPGLVAGRERVVLLAHQASYLFLLGRRDEELAVLREILRLSDELDQPALRAQARRMLGFFHGRSGRAEEARSILEEATALARAGDDAVEEAKIAQTLASVALNQGRYEDALAVYRQALDAARRAGHRPLEGQVLGSMGVAMMGLRRLDEAQRLLEEALAIARELGSRSLELIAVGNLGAVILDAERYDEARPFLEEHLRLARRTGIRLGETYATGNLAELFQNLGRIADALDGFDRSLAIAREGGYRLAEAENHDRVGAALAIVGRWEEARRSHERCLELGREIQNARVEGFALIGLGSLAEQLGDLAGAEILYERAEKTWSVIGSTPDLTLLFLRRGCLLRRMDRPDEARADLREAEALGRQFRSSKTEVLASAHLALLPGGVAEEPEERFASLEPRLPFLARMETRLLLWLATGHRSHLEAAHELVMKLRDNAPERDRAAMIRNVPLYIDIESAWSSLPA